MADDFIIEGKINANSDDALGSIDEVNSQLTELDSMETTSELDADPDDALAGTEEATGAVEQFDGMSATAELDIDTSGAEAGISTLASGLGALAGIASFSALTGLSGQVDDLAKMAKGLGVNIELLQGYSFAAGQAGVSNKELTKTFFKINVIMAKYEEQLNEIGFVTRNSNGEMKSTAQIIEELVVNWDTLTSSEETNNALMEILGPKTYFVFNKLAEQGAESLKELSDEFIENNAITTEQAAVYESFNDALDKLQKTIITLIIKALLPLMGHLTNLLIFVEENIQAMKDFIGQFPRLVKVIKQVIKIVSILILAFIAYVIIIGAARTINKLFMVGQTLMTIRTIIQTVVTWLLIGAKFALNIIMKLLNISYLKLIIKQTIMTVKSGIQTVVTWALIIAKTALNIIIRLLNISFLKNIISSTIMGIKTVFQTIVTWALVAAKFALNVIMKILALNPWTITITIIIILIAFLIIKTDILIKIFELLKPILIFLAEKFMDLARILAPLVGIILRALAIVINLILIVLEKWINIIVRLAEIIWTVLQPPLEWLLGIFEKILNVINKVVEAFAGFVGAIGDFFGGLFGGGGGSQVTASGGGGGASAQSIIPDIGSSISNSTINTDRTVNIFGVKTMTPAEKLNLGRQQNRDLFKSMKGRLV